MRKEQKEQMESYRRIEEFVRAHPLPGGASYGGAAGVLADANVRVAAHARDQAAGIRLGATATHSKRELQTALRVVHLRPIWTVAQADLPETQGVAKALRMPREGLSVTKLIAEAKAMREAVGPHAAQFVAHGRPADFLERLDAAIAALDGSITGKSRIVANRQAARAGMQEQLARARKAALMLDAIVHAQFKDQPTVLEKWRAAYRVRGVPTVAAPAVPEGGDVQAA